MAKNTQNKSAPTPAPASAPKAQAQPKAATLEPKPAGPTPSATAKQITRDDIARAAYFRWQKHGGDELSNWIAAEHELRAAR
ncbi:MAG: DUF2934 domain-containing protein [Phycisphaerae bacterium]|nr:DUF2934 domain-containing protein [Phycisphaerae bacterium]